MTIQVLPSGKYNLKVKVSALVRKGEIQIFKIKLQKYDVNKLFLGV